MRRTCNAGWILSGSQLAHIDALGFLTFQMALQYAFTQWCEGY